MCLILISAFLTALRTESGTTCDSWFGRVAGQSTPHNNSHLPDHRKVFLETIVTPRIVFPRMHTWWNKLAEPPLQWHPEQDGKLLHSFRQSPRPKPSPIVFRSAGCGVGDPRKTPKHFFVGLTIRLALSPFLAGMWQSDGALTKNTSGD